ncbi:hypothetical protein N9L48_05280, partial [Psychrosphaera sp.]|nr:hypothetical protein [Psychrosphaera sp.]
APNPYMEKAISIESMDFNSSIPINLDKELGWQFWFKQDLRYRVPKGNIYLGFDLPNGVDSKRNQALMRLYCELFMDKVSDVHYQAEMAGLHYNVYAHAAGITLYTSGFSSNQSELMFTLISSLFTISPSRSRFEEIKRQLTKHWRNSDSNKPISQLFSLLNSHLVSAAATPQELAKELEDVSVEDFKIFTSSLFDQIYVETLVYGNWSTTQANAINESLKNLLSGCKRVEETQREIRSVDDIGVVELEKKVEHQDSAALVYLQGMSTSSNHDNEIEMAYFILASQILAPFAFNLLRSEKQLGYMVGSGYMPIRNVPGLAVYVQSHDYDSKRLTDELNNCLQFFAPELQSLSAEDFERHKNAVIMQYKEKPTNLAQQSQQLWVSIGNQDYKFDQKEKIVNELASIRQDELYHWYASKFTPSLNKGVLVNSR